MTVSLEVAVLKGCDCKKIAYSSRREALLRAKRGNGISAYHCPAADVWHVTSKPNGPAKKRYDRFDDPDLARERARAKKKARKTAAAKQRPVPVVAPAASRVSASRVGRTGCRSCGRLWLSDLNPQGRCCPACGGSIRLGSDAIDRFGL